MKDGEGVAEMYSRLDLITKEIAGLGSEEMTDKFIIKKILRALDGKYDTVCTLIQMMPNYKDLKPTEVIGGIVAHEMSLKDKEELHNCWRSGNGGPQTCLPAACLKGGPARPIFINTDPRPSRGAKPRRADDTELPQARPHQDGSRGGGEIKAGFLMRCP